MKKLVYVVLLVLLLSSVCICWGQVNANQAKTSQELFEMYGNQLATPLSAASMAAVSSKSGARAAAVAHAAGPGSTKALIAVANGHYFGTGDQLRIALQPNQLISEPVQVTARVLPPGKSGVWDGTGDRIKYFDVRYPNLGLFHRGMTMDDKVEALSMEFTTADPDGEYVVDIVVWNMNTWRVYQQIFVTVKHNSAGDIEPWNGTVEQVRTGYINGVPHIELYGRFPKNEEVLVHQGVLGRWWTVHTFSDANNGYIRVPLAGRYGPVPRRMQTYVTVFFPQSLYSVTVPVVMDKPMPMTANQAVANP